MEKFFLGLFGITFGAIFALAIIGGSIYWWVEVRVPKPPELILEVDGFPDFRETDDGKKALIRFVITNKDNSKISINDARLYITRVSDGARTRLSFEIENILLYPNEKFVELVPTFKVGNDWLVDKSIDEFEDKYDYFEYKNKWNNQIKKNSALIIHLYQKN
jgi:hypothetical protein